MRSVTPGRGSKLAPHASALLQLRAAGYTITQVVQFLAQLGVSTSRSNVHAYLARLQRDGAPGLQVQPRAPHVAPAQAGPVSPQSQPQTQPADASLPGSDSPERLSIRAIRDKPRNLRELAEYARKNMPPNT